MNHWILYYPNLSLILTKFLGRCFSHFRCMTYFLRKPEINCSFGHVINKVRTLYNTDIKDINIIAQVIIGMRALLLVDN